MCPALWHVSRPMTCDKVEGQRYEVNVVVPASLNMFPCGICQALRAPKHGRDALRRKLLACVQPYGMCLALRQNKVESSSLLPYSTLTPVHIQVQPHIGIKKNTNFHARMRTKFLACVCVKRWAPLIATRCLEAVGCRTYIRK